jgi:hypothetical protein
MTRLNLERLFSLGVHGVTTAKLELRPTAQGWRGLFVTYRLCFTIRTTVNTISSTPMTTTSFMGE